MSPARRADAGVVRLPADLVGPDDLELAKAVDEIPGERALPGGSRYEPKWDGAAAPSFGAVTRRGCARQCKDLTDRFPDIAAAAVRQVEEGVVLDGELLMLVEGRLSFDALQRRLVTAPAKARRLVGAVPASYVAFGLLAVAGVDLRTQRWTVRRGRLEQLAGSFSPPWS